jgi:hypothetical protein
LSGPEKRGRDIGSIALMLMYRLRCRAAGLAERF